MHNSARRPSDEFTFVSLFCGCGGLDYGFVQAGFRCLAAFDSDPLALQAHHKAIRATTFECDLSTGLLPYNYSQTPDVVLAGPPCQGFSTIGKRKIDDERNHLLVISAKIAVDLNPAVFILENVPAVRSGAHLKYWSKLEAVLTKAGYTCSTFSLKASDFGVAQIRKRIFLIATKPQMQMTFPTSQRRSATLRDAIGDLAPGAPALNHRPTFLEPNEIAARIARRIEPGKKLCNVRAGINCVHTWQIPEVFGKTTRSEREVLGALIRLRRRERVRATGDADPVLVSSVSRHISRSAREDIISLIKKRYLRATGGLVDFRQTFNGKFRRLSWDQVSFTVDTRFGDARNFLHPDQDRSFTVREAARIQGFPDSFVFLGKDNDQFRLVGNAVPPPVAKAIALRVFDVLRG